ncbi:MAG: cell division protein ZapA [Sphingomonadaceae bacterium]|nr:cell division protein ZapA [Sphingomonadaceae bacterium]
MGDVSLSIGGQHYSVSCRDGEEDHLREIAQLVNAKTREARMAVGDGLGEVRQLLFAALLLADEANELRKGAVDGANADKLDDLAARIERIAGSLAQPANAP